MDQELNDRLTKIEKMLNDNNRMLVRMRRAQKNAAFRSIIYWLVIIALSVASYYAIKPYITSWASAFGIGSSTAAPATSPTTTSEVMSLIQQYEATQKTAK